MSCAHVIGHPAGAEKAPIDGQEVLVTLPRMSSRKRPFDKRSRRPRDYFSEPADFGRDDTTRSVLPPDGDQRSGDVALVQHQLVFAMGYPRDRATTKRVTKRFGFSKQHWSDCLLGKAWMGDTVLAAAVSVLLDVFPRTEVLHPPRPVRRGGRASRRSTSRRTYIA